MLLSQFILPPLLSLQPSVSTCPLFTSASLLLPCKWAPLYHFSRFHIFASHRGHKIPGRSISNLRYADDTTLMAESEEELKRLLMKKVKEEESEKVGLKSNIQKLKIVASGPVTLWQIDGENREGNGTPLQHSCLGNPMDGGAWWAAVHGVAKTRTRLNDFTFSFHFHALEKEMAAHSSVLAWRIPGTEEPGGLPSMGSHRVRHD